MPNIRLSKQTKTIKVVNRRDNIRLNKDESVVTLKHTGKIGPQGPTGPLGPSGPQGDSGVSTLVRVVHGSDPNVPRPDALYVEWVGSVAPNNATVDDTWINTA